MWRTIRTLLFTFLGLVNALVACLIAFFDATIPPESVATAAFVGAAWGFMNAAKE